MRRFVFLTLVACSPEIDLSPQGRAPEGVILAPSDGSVVPRGVVPALGQVSSPVHLPSRLFAVWSLRDAEGRWRDVCDNFAEEDGTTRCLVPAAPGDEGLRLRVVDLAGFRGDAYVDFQVVDRTPPEVEVVGPDPADGPLYEDHPVPVFARVGDEQDDVGSLELTWSSDREGALDGPNVPDRLGRVEGVLDLGEGLHQIALEVRDTFGLTARDQVAVLVGPPNEPPVCRVDAPAPGQVQATGTMWVVEGFARDPEWGRQGVTVRVRSDVDGLLATGGLQAPSVFRFPDIELTRGSHVLTVQVEDHVGARCERLVPVEIDVRPEVTVSAPEDGLVLPSGSFLDIRARMTHPTVDGRDLTLRVDSDLSGPLGQWAGDVSGRVEETISIAPGNHGLTFQAVDDRGLHSEVVVREVAVGVAP